MTYVNHTRNKFSEDSQNRSSTPASNNAALRGALLAFARPQAELQHAYESRKYHGRAPSVATPVLKDRPEPNQSQLTATISSQAAFLRAPSPSKSLPGDRAYQRQSLAVSVAGSLPRSRSPLSAAASVTAYRLSPQSTGRRQSSTKSVSHEWEFSEQEEHHELAVAPATVNGVDSWLDDMNRPKNRNSFAPKQPFRRGMTLRPHVNAPTGSAVHAAGTDSPSLASFRNSRDHRATPPEVRAPRPLRRTSATMSFGAAMLRASPRSLSTDMHHDGSDYDPYEHSTYEQSTYEQGSPLRPEGHDQSSEEEDTSEHESSSGGRKLSSGRMQDALSWTESEPYPGDYHEPADYYISAPISVPAAQPSFQAASRPSLGSPPVSFVSESVRSLALVSPTIGRRAPPLATSGWQSPAHNSRRSSTMLTSTATTSRAPSPLKSPMRPPPRTRRHTDQTKFYRKTLRIPGRGARSPSPPRSGFKQTLRKAKSSSSDDDSRALKPRSRFHLRKHPNKHHEGDRKRWRNEITPRELKRYEGLWATNRGLLLAPDRQLTEQEAATDTLKMQVSNLVVKDLWSRSRLPANVLEEVWELVDQQGVGRLTKDQFVVGMWFVDQRLKGRKLPIKVSHSVWASARGMYGLKRPKLKDIPG